MCTTFYIASAHALPLVSWNERAPGFYVTELDPARKEYSTVKELLQLDHLYFAGSYMGCSCGLYFYGKTSESKEHDIALRIRDLMALKNYLQEHLKENDMKLFMTWGDEFDYEYEELSVSTINTEQYIIEQDVVYNLKF